MQDMPRPRPPHLHKETTRHGKTVWYVRRTPGPRVRIKAEYGTPEFQEAYEAALEQRPIQKASKETKGTLGWLVALYRKSESWSRLSLATRKQRENILRPILADHADTALSKITRRSISRGIDKRKDTPAQARNYLDAMRGLFRWCEESQLGRDPTAGLKVTRAETDGFPVWTADDIARFRRHWPVGTRERVMFDIFYLTGLRRGDAARLGKQHARSGVIEIDTEKTGTRVTLRILPELQATLDAGPTGELAYIAAVDGQPLTKESVGNLFRDACRAAGIKKSAHGLRKAAATRAAENGATVAQLEALFGWTGGQMASLYTRSADRKRLALEAADLLAADKTETAMPSPQTQVRAKGRKSQ